MHHGSGSIAPPRTTLWRGWMLVVGLVFFVVGAAAGGAKQAPSGGCQHPAAISVSLGAGEKTGKESKVLDSNLGSEWIAWGKGESMWLELASPTVIDAVAIAFRKVTLAYMRRIWHISIFPPLPYWYMHYYHFYAN